MKGYKPTALKDIEIDALETRAIKDLGCMCCTFSAPEVLSLIATISALKNKERKKE